MSKISGGVKNPRTTVNNRRKGALARLEAQLVEGIKPGYAEDGTKQATVSLTPDDRKRMEREIETLKSRIK